MNWFYQEKQPQNLTFANVLNQLDKTIDAAIYKVYIFCCLSICEKNSDSFLVTVGSKNKFVKKKKTVAVYSYFFQYVMQILWIKFFWYFIPKNFKSNLIMLTFNFYYSK